MQEVHPQPENRPHARYPTDAPEPASVPGAAPAEIWARLPPGAYTRRWVFFRQALRSALLGICALPGRRAARRLLWAAGFALLLGGLAGAMGMLLTGTDTALLPACLGSFVGYLLVLAGLTGTRSAWRIRRQLRRFGGAVLTPPSALEGFLRRPGPALGRLGVGAALSGLDRAGLEKGQAASPPPARRRLPHGRRGALLPAAAGRAPGRLPPEPSAAAPPVGLRLLLAGGRRSAFPEQPVFGDGGAGFPANPNSRFSQRGPHCAGLQPSHRPILPARASPLPLPRRGGPETPVAVRRLLRRDLPDHRRQHPGGTAGRHRRAAPPGWTPTRPPAGGSSIWSCPTRASRCAGTRKASVTTCSPKTGNRSITSGSSLTGWGWPSVTTGACPSGP